MKGIRKYATCVPDVYKHVKMDRDFIRSWARICDDLKKWENPDDEDWQTPLLKGPLPVPFLHKGEMRVNEIAYLNFEGNIVLSVFSNEIRSKNTLKELAETYKRLREPPVIPEMALHPRSMNGALTIIIRKMLWLSSGRGKAAEAAA